MSNWKVIFATVIIFGAGVLTGGLLVSHVENSRTKPAKHTSSAAADSASQNRVKQPHVPELLNRQFLQRLDEDLRLTKEQHDAVQKIMNEGQNQMRKAVQDARLEIREVLSPEQRGQFDELVKRPFRKPIFSTNAPAALPPTNSAAAE